MLARLQQQLAARCLRSLAAAAAARSTTHPPYQHQPAAAAAMAAAAAWQTAQRTLWQLQQRVVLAQQPAWRRPAPPNAAIAAWQHSQQQACARLCSNTSTSSSRPFVLGRAPFLLAAPGGGSSSSVWSRSASLGSHRGLRTAADQARARHKRGIADGGLYLGAVVLGMLGLSYASVPLYRAFCQATGYGGTVSQTHNIEAKLKAREEAPNPGQEARAAQREIRVWFTADVADDMPWSFTPTQDYVTVHPGESVLAFFTARNRSTVPVTGVSTYNVVPDKAAYYFNKVQCFCFEEQRLRPGEEVDMPVFFYLDPEMVDDFNCRNVHDITLSYTFFKIEDEDAADLSTSGVRLHAAGELPAGVKPPAQPMPVSLQQQAAGGGAGAGGGGAAAEAAAGGGGAVAVSGASQ